MVFVPKYCKKVIYGEKKQETGKILRELCDREDVEILEANASSDYIHMLLKIPTKMSILYFRGYMKGKSTLLIFEDYINLKYKYSIRNFWSKRHYVGTVGGNKEAIR